VLSAEFRGQSPAPLHSWQFQLLGIQLLAWGRCAYTARWSVALPGALVLIVATQA